MKNKKSSNKKLYLVLALVASIVIVFLALSNYIFNYYLKTPATIEDSSSNNAKIYRNDIDGFSFEYPKSYNIEETIREGNTLIDLNKDKKLDEQGYSLLKGTEIALIYRKNVQLSNKYIREKDWNYFDDPRADGKINELKVNNIDSFKVTYGAHNSNLNTPTITKFYLKNGNDVLELSFIWGHEITKAEYENYLNDFTSIVNSIRFQ